MTSRRADRHLSMPRLALLAALLLLPATAWSQLSVRPDDPLGVSIREQRVRVIHSDSPEVPGTSMHLQQFDPWLAYQRGRSYFFREWGTEDGVFHALPMRPQASATTSCGMCHNLPFGGVGAGGNVSAPVGLGRNTPHFYGAGLLETLAVQMRAQVLAANDDNGNGYLDVPAETKGRRMLVEAAPGVTLDFGSLDDLDGDHLPDLNRVVMLRMVDEHGQRKLVTKQGRRVMLGDPGIVGYDFAFGVLASFAGDHMFPALRVFAIGVLNNIMGILPDAPVRDAAPLPGFWWTPWGEVTNAGAMQTEVLLTGNPAKIDDPRRRGTISIGEIDLFEWFMMNHPRPALGPQNAETRRGRELMDTIGCTSCHTADWVIQPADDQKGLPGDRRFFDLEVAHNPQTGRLEGRLHDLARTVEGPNGEQLLVPRRDGFVAENVYTDLRHHYVGERFNDYQYRGGKVSAVKQARTPPLWGVGSTAPYGHDGMSPTLDDVIRRHGGEAEEPAKKYREAPAADRKAVVAFLRSLVLFQPQDLPTDLDGDGVISPHYKLAGREVGPERFQPELLFRRPPRYAGWTEGPDGSKFFSYALLNVSEAYGEDLAALADGDGDTVPDLLDTDSGEEATRTADAIEVEPAEGR